MATQNRRNKMSLQSGSFQNLTVSSFLTCIPEKDTYF